MKNNHKAPSVFLVGLVLAVLPFTLLAQVEVPVVEAGTSPSGNAAPAGNQNDVLVKMFLQLEALQSEIQNLRGTVEEQSYQIRRMQIEQRDRYLDTDSRLTELYNEVQAHHSSQGGLVQLPVGGVQTPSVQSSNETAINSQPNQTQPEAAAPNPVASGAGIDVNIVQNEQQLYRQALNLLLEDEAYQDAINLFQQYIDVYADGRYLTNALYWQGAALELVGNYSQAIVVLLRLINEHPQDPKAPTALLRLGTVYQEMGDSAQAADNWTRISELYPDANSEIEIANENLRALNN
ncbi:MAG: YbgF trimerization domain-containing protein [Pseudohongiellaceae bacterium]